MVRQYSIALISLTIALLVRWALDPILQDHLAFPTLYVAIAITAWYGGLRPTLLVTLAGLFVAAYVFIPPRYSLEIALPSHRFQAFSFLSAGIVIAIFGETARAAKRRVEEKAAELQRQQVQLAAEVAARQKAELQLQERNEELQHANVNKDRFIAFFGHELRNPLGAIHATLEVLHQQVTEERLEANLQLMARNAQSLSRMAEDLLDVSRISRGVMELRLQPVNAVQALRDAVESVRPFVLMRRHELTMAATQDEVWIQADSVRLEQILSNLLHNAAKYTDPGGTISVGVASEGEEAVLRICDTGRGIPSRDLERIFEPFIQVDPPADRTQGGMGLGLALVKKLVQMHGGVITALSAGPGQGSEFFVRLPLFRPAASRSTRDTASGRQRILLVDDNRDLAESMGELLTHMGYEVRVAFSGEEALCLARELEPHAVILDIGLPDMDGCEVARQLREDPRFERTLLVAMTGYGITGDETDSRAAGFDRQLVKPVASAAVRQVLVEELA
jgi:two-component system CheB/CheR fusion protein